MLLSASDRIGGLDFQATPDEYVPRGDTATLDELQRAADIVDRGEPLSASLAAAVLHGTSIGGARPKATVQDDGTAMIAKFSSATDTRSVIKAECVAMDLARRAGLEVAPVRMTRSHGKDVLLVERFDRPGGGRRRLMVSALTMLGLSEYAARASSYADLSDLVRRDFTDPRATLRELFARIVFNIAVGNTDDHARNHAAFWDGHRLTLTPAYDLTPQPRSGQVAAQAMAIGRAGERASQFRVAVDACEVYLLDRPEAQAVVEQQVTAIREGWADAAEVARLTAADRADLWERQVLNPYCFYDEA